MSIDISSLAVDIKKGAWSWDDQTNELHFESSVKEKKPKRETETTRFWGINGLTYASLKVNLKFKSNITEAETMKFRDLLIKRNLESTNSVVTIQDCKLVAVFLCTQKLPKVFHKFYNLLSVNQLLRACIVYILFYLQIQYYLREGNLPPNKTSIRKTYKEDLEDLRVLIGRFYAGIIFEEFTSSDIARTDEIILFECFLKVSAIAIWIALERKYLEIIKVELERIFRSNYFNSSTTNQTISSILHFIQDENHLTLQEKVGVFDKKKVKTPNKLTSNSPIIHDFLIMNKPALIMIGRKDFEILRDDRLKFLTKYIFTPESKIQQEGVCIGILGLHKRLFDPLLYPRSKKALKLLVTGSPMDISEERKRLRETALKKILIEQEVRSPHVFDELPTIPRPNQFNEEIVNKEIFESEEVEEEVLDNEEEEGVEDGEEEEDDEEECEEESWTELEH